MYSFSVLWHKAVKDAQGIILDEDLSVGVWSCADADGGDAEQLCDFQADFAWDRLDDDGKAAGVLEGEGVLDEVDGRVCCLALHTESAQGHGCLRREANVSDDGHTDLCDALNGCGHLAAALELDGLRAPLGNEADGVGEGLLGRDLVAAKGHVAHQEWVLGSASDGTAMVQHFLFFFFFFGGVG